MLFPYVRRFPHHTPCAIDRWVGPWWKLLERHEVEVSASPALALEALSKLRMEQLPTVRGLLALRGLARPPDTTVLDFFSSPPFVLLERVNGTELVGGVVVPRRGAGANGTETTARSPEEFEEILPKARFAAIAIFRAEPGERGARLWTETWVRLGGPFTTLAFAAYWFFVGPFSAWIRRTFLREARKSAEVAASGDLAPAP